MHLKNRIKRKNDLNICENMLILKFRLLDLNQEYEKLSRKRQEQCNMLADQWQSYQQSQKESRQSEISKRQIEFDRQLDLLDEEKRKKWTSQNNDASVVCSQLLAYLQQCSTDNCILTFPTDILDLFWSIDIQVPVLETELPLTIEKLKELSKC